MTADRQGRISLGPVEKAACGIVVSLITGLLCYIAWKVTDLGERVAVLEFRANYSDIHRGGPLP